MNALEIVEEGISGQVVDMLTEAQAWELLDGIKVNLADVSELVDRLYEGRGWLALGYESWDYFCQCEIRPYTPRLNVDARRQEVARLTSAGFSQRAIASALGIGLGTVGRDQSSAPNGAVVPSKVTGLDGRTVERHPEVDSGPRPIRAQLNTGNNEWYTPAEYIHAARVAMGGIDLDPATCDIANRTVGATRFFTKENDGLAQEWGGRVWMNPPYADDLILQFVAKLLEEYASGRVTAACVLVNNCTETRWFRRLASAATAHCLLSSRVKFLNKLGVAGAPTQGQVVLYLGADWEAFIEAFAPFGLVYGAPLAGAA